MGHFLRLEAKFRYAVVRDLSYLLRLKLRLTALFRGRCFSFRSCLRALASRGGCSFLGTGTCKGTHLICAFRTEPFTFWNG